MDLRDGNAAVGRKWSVVVEPFAVPRPFVEFAARRISFGSQLANGLLERLAVDVLHRVVIDALLLPDGEHGHDVRVMQLGRRLRFVAEPGDLPLIEHRGERQYF